MCRGGTDVPPRGDYCDFIDEADLGDLPDRLLVFALQKVKQ